MHLQAFQPVDHVAEARSKRKNHQAFYTPLSLVADMIKHSRNWEGCRAFEPSAGDGRIVHALQQAGCIVDACEIDADMAERCRGYGATMIGTDFLAVKPEPIYDLILMNPPFQKGQARKHVEHAYRFLKPTGQLVTVLPCSEDVELVAARYDLPGCNAVSFEELSADTFKESGASARTILAWLEGPEPCRQCETFKNHSTFGAAVTIASTQPLYEATRQRPHDAQQISAAEFRKCGMTAYGVDWREVAAYVADDEDVAAGAAPAGLLF